LGGTKPGLPSSGPKSICVGAARARYPQARTSMGLPTLQTDRLLLRPYLPTDVADLVRLAGTQEVAATTLRIPHPYREQDALDFVASCAPDAELERSTRFAITLRNGGQFLGGVGLRLERWQHQAELGYWLGVPYWGKGYATESAQAVVRFGFETLKLHRIFASHFAHNPASGRILRKIGMHYEGCLRGNVFKWDKFYDSELYSILSTDRRGP
jgi:[ribosomal protein S5]-alanine N-acetyltransferase